MHENYAVSTLEKPEKQKWESRKLPNSSRRVRTKADSMTARLLCLAREEV
jgi:hypothetical protein